MKTQEEIAIAYGLCSCDEAYTKRGLTAPDCPWHAFAVSEAMDEWAGNLISQRSSITNVYDIPKHILDEYAKRKVIDFNKWQTEHGYVNGFDDTWIKALNGSPVASSTEELYNQFTQQIENK